MAGAGATYDVQLGFTPASQVIPDHERPPLLRARSRGATPYGDEGIELHTCPAIDMTRDDSIRPDLLTHGFDRVDLSGSEALQRVAREIRLLGSISDAAASAIRGALVGAVLECSSGRRLEVLHVADEGLIMRSGGPNGLDVAGPRSKGMNGHGPATSVHSDQDVHGTPLVQLMDGRAPSLFHHDSPDGSNHDASLVLVNLWIPLQQITQPLVLADGRTVDRPRQQLRFGLATDSFLDRVADQTVNDIWTYLHHPDQRWYFSSEMDHRSAYVFDTLSTPHTAGTLAGEDVAERLYLALETAEAAVGRSDRAELHRALGAVDDVEVPAAAPPALRRAIAEMAELVRRASSPSDPLADDEAVAWVGRSRAARRAVVRMSVELRLVASVSD